MIGPKINLGNIDLTAPPTDPIYFIHWYIVFCKRCAVALKKAGVEHWGAERNASHLSDWHQQDLLCSFIRLAGLDGCPFEVQKIKDPVLQDQDGGTHEYAMMVWFPWGQDRDIYYSHDFRIDPFGDLFSTSGLQDLALCLEIWLKEGARETLIGLRSELPLSSTKTQSNASGGGDELITTREACKLLETGKTTLMRWAENAGVQTVSRGYWRKSHIEFLKRTRGTEAKNPDPKGS